MVQLYITYCLNLCSSQIQLLMMPVIFKLTKETLLL